MNTQLSLLKSSILFTFAVFTAAFVGCGGDNVHVSGKVTFSDDNSPLTAGVVNFESASHNARGDVKPDGTFVIGTLKENDGLPRGNYRVSITRARKSIGKDEGGDDIFEPLIDEKYALGHTSGITMDVTSSMKNVEIKVERYDPAKKQKDIP